MEKNKDFKKILIALIAVLVLTVAILIAVFFLLLKKEKPSKDYKVQTLQSLNTAVNDKNKNGDFGISEALEVLYSNGQDVVSRDDKFTYVWNKDNQEFEYVERSKLSSLGREYQEMEIIDDALGVQDACENGGIFYLDKDVTLTDDGIKSFSVKSDVVLVGGQDNIILSNLTDAIFTVDKEGVNLTVYGIKLMGKSTDDKTGTNSGICVNSNNAKINVYGCDFSNVAYSINVRNYGNLAYKFTSGNPISAGCKEDAKCFVTVKNSCLNGKGCVNWKYVGGRCQIENSSLYSNDDWTLLCLEGNGLSVDVKNCSLLNSNKEACAGVIQCFAKDCTLNFKECKTVGLTKTDMEMLALLSTDDYFGSEQDALDYSVYSGKVGGVYIDLSDDNWGVQEGNEVIVDNQVVCDNN